MTWVGDSRYELNGSWLVFASRGFQRATYRRFPPRSHGSVVDPVTCVPYMKKTELNKMLKKAEHITNRQYLCVIGVILVGSVTLSRSKVGSGVQRQ